MTPRPRLLAQRIEPMPGSLLQTLRPQRVAVFRALQLGDMLCATPALRALRLALPDAHITLVGLPWARDLQRRLGHLLDAHLSFPGFAGLPEQDIAVRAWPDFLRAAHRVDFDLAIQMHGDGSRTNGLVELLGARVNAGFACTPWGTTPDPGSAFMPYPDSGAEPARLLELMRFLGADIEHAGTELEYPLLRDDLSHWAERPDLMALPTRGYICIHPGGRSPDRRWPASCFARVADELAEETGMPIVLTGSEHEAGLTRAVMQAMRRPAIDAAAAVPVGALAALLGRSRLLVSNDTGTSHLAAALHLPSVIVFRASDTARWAPLDLALHRPVWDPFGERADEVLRQARRLLGLREDDQPSLWHLPAASGVRSSPWPPRSSGPGGPGGSRPLR